MTRDEARAWAARLNADGDFERSWSELPERDTAQVAAMRAYACRSDLRDLLATEWLVYARTLSKKAFQRGECSEEEHAIRMCQTTLMLVEISLSQDWDVAQSVPDSVVVSSERMSDRDAATSFRTSALFCLARLALRAGDLEECERLLNPLIAARPLYHSGQAPYLEARASVHFARGHRDEALRDLEAAGLHIFSLPPFLAGKRRAWLIAASRLLDARELTRDHLSAIRHSPIVPRAKRVCIELARRCERRMQGYGALRL